MNTPIVDTESEKVFPCKEVNCSGQVNCEIIATFLRTGSQNSQAACCDTCGRLYIASKGKPANNRLHEKPFWINDKIEFKPMNSAEKSQVFTELLDSQKTERQVPEYYQGQMSFLLGLGHANDCPAKDTIGECVCGHADAERWLREHKNVPVE